MSAQKWYFRGKLTLNISISSSCCLYVTGSLPSRRRSELWLRSRSQLPPSLKRFSDEFYQEIFRLKGWPWEGMQVNRPQVVGHYTNDIVYDRLTPGLLEQLQLRNPKDESGERKHKHHQWLSDDFGQPELYTHLVGAIAIMNTVRINKPERAWPEFKRRLQRWRPKLNTTLDIGLDDEGD